MHGIRGEGYCRVEITFTGLLNIRQIGHSTLHIDKYDEDYLILLPDAHVKGFLSGRLYPEIKGAYSVILSSGFVSRIEFLGAGLFGSGESNSFHAIMYHRDNEGRPLYEISGRCSDRFTMRDARTSAILEEYDTNAGYHRPVEPCMQVP
ncbi:hypothetical protein F5Y19DRAFT_481088 [Xylariaceae sp. FL1651]|nr:hypothetical protein F5Y19DRAFT_481088 [Xylariaceae sp. FL1651]